MQIKVGWRDILWGIRREPLECPVNRAIRRQVPHVHFVWVGRQLEVALADGYVSQTVMGALRKKIMRFDRWGLIWPFAFEMQEARPWEPSREHSLEPSRAEARSLDEMLAETEPITV